MGGFGLDMKWVLVEGRDRVLGCVFPWVERDVNVLLWLWWWVWEVLAVVDGGEREVRRRRVLWLWVEEMMEGLGNWVGGGFKLVCSESSTFFSQCITERSMGNKAILPGEKGSTVTSIFSCSTGFRVSLPI